MKYKTTNIFLCVLLIGVLFISGCTDDVDKTNGIASMQQIDVNLDVEDDEIATCIYQNENNMIFSIGTRNGKTEGPLVNTDRLSLYNIDEQKETILPIHKDENVYRAMELDGGILYAIYKLREDNKYDWFLNYFVNNEERAIDKGICDSYDDIPAMKMIDNIPYYLYCDEHLNSNEKYELGVRRIKNNDVETIFSETQKTAVSMSAFLSNGKEYCFLKGSTLPIICIGDDSGIKYEKKMNMKMVDYGINDDFVICSLGIEEGDQEKLALLSINLKNGDVMKNDAEEQYYRIQGSGNAFLCVDWQFAPYQINIENKGTPAVTKLDYPGDVDLPNSNVFFSPLGDQKYMVIYNRNTSDSDSQTEYYKLELA